MEIAKYYTDAFFDDCRKLNIKRPDVVEPATGCIDEYIKIVSGLLDKGYAYVAGGNVYFDSSKLDHYYVFNDHDEEDLAVGVREGVEEDTNKRNKNDFVLWFTKSKFEDQALKWDSPGVWAIPAGILSAPASPSNTTGNTWTSTAAAWITPSPTTPTRSPSPRAIWDTPGADIGSMSII